MSFFPERNRGTDILIQIDEVQVCGDTGKEPISLQSRSFSTSGRWPYFSTPPGSTLLLKSWPACWSLLSVVSQPLLDVPTFTTSLYLLLSQMKPHCIHMSLFCSKPNQQVTHTLALLLLKSGKCSTRLACALSILSFHMLLSGPLLTLLPPTHCIARLAHPHLTIRSQLELLLPL